MRLRFVDERVVGEYEVGKVVIFWKTPEFWGHVTVVVFVVNVSRRIHRMDDHELVGPLARDGAQQWDEEVDLAVFFFVVVDDLPIANGLGQVWVILEIRRRLWTWRGFFFFFGEGEAVEILAIDVALPEEESLAKIIFFFFFLDRLFWLGSALDGFFLVRDWIQILNMIKIILRILSVR